MILNDFDINYKLKSMNCDITDLYIEIKKMQERILQLDSKVFAQRILLEKEGLIKKSEEKIK